jgi:hypothetical protein
MDPELAALQLIVARLGNELELAFNSNPERNWPEYERARYIHALATIAKFLGANTKSQDIAKRFWRLSVALADLDRGAVDPLLAPTATGGVNPGDDSWTRCARAKVALGIHALILAGLTRKLAAEEAAAKFPEISKLAAFERENSSPTKTKILNWYDDFKKPAGTGRTIARAIFEDGRRLLDDLATQDLTAQNLRAIAKVYLQQASAEGLRKQT